MKEQLEEKINVIGAGLAGSEVALYLAKNGKKVKLYEMKKIKKTPAHHIDECAEIVCSNSFKSNLLTNACGLLKEELRILGSNLIKVADEVALPAGQALAVDREQFAKKVTKQILENKNITLIDKEIDNLDELEGTIVIATGPLTDEKLFESIQKMLGDNGLYFFDAAAPIIEKDSINFDVAFLGNRYEQEKKKEESIEQWHQRLKMQEPSYINLPLNKEEYEELCNDLVSAKTVVLKEFEKREIFEGCMPIEIMAKRGMDTLRFGPLKPVGFDDPRTGKRPYGLIQLRQDNAIGTLYNMVGFQTNLTYPEQQRIFNKIPGLENARFTKFGVMHRNTYINGSKFLNNKFKLKTEKEKQIYFAGQISGVEGYVESIASGIVVARDILNFKDDFSNKTMIGALSNYISTTNDNFQPMNANFGIIQPLDNDNKKVRKDKKKKYEEYAKRSIEEIKNIA